MKKLSFLLFFCGFCNAGEFIISYWAKVKNDILYGEQYKVSKVLDEKGKEGLKKGSYKVFKTCEIIPIEQIKKESEEEKRFLKTHKNEVLDCLYGSGVKLYDEVIAQNLQAQSKTILKIPPTRIIIEVENGVVNLVVLEENFKKGAKNGR